MDAFGWNLDCLQVDIDVLELTWLAILSFGSVLDGAAVVIDGDADALLQIPIPGGELPYLGALYEVSGDFDVVVHLSLVFGFLTKQQGSRS